MKTINILKRVVLAFAAALAMAACQTGTEPQIVPGGEIDLSKLKFEVSVADKPAWNSPGGGAETRAVKQAWDAGDVIVIYFDGTSQNRMFLQYTAGGEWQLKEGENYALTGTVSENGGKANALHAFNLDAVASSAGSEVSLVADRDLLYDDAGKYVIYNDGGQNTMRVNLTMNSRPTSMITVEGLDNPEQWTLDGLGLKPFRQNTIVAFGDFDTTWEATLSPLFLASHYEGGTTAAPTVGYAGQTGAAVYWVIDGSGADSSTTFLLKNTTTGETKTRTYTGADRDLVAGQAYVIQGPDGTEADQWSAPVEVLSVELSQQNALLESGNALQLTATVLPENATNKTIVWTSDNPAVATVDPATGMVTTMGYGIATITATTADGNKVASCVVKSATLIEAYNDLHIIHKTAGVQVVAAKKDGSVLKTTFAAPAAGLMFRYNSPNVTFDFQLHDKIARPSAIAPAEKTLVGSDFHGQLDAFAAFLKGNGVVDNDFNWIYGTNNVIIQGDFLDRGRYDIGIGWLIYKLEAEAAAAGGRLDFINGNHEDLVPRNDLRYPHADVLAFATKAGITHDKFFGTDTEMGRWIRDRHLALTMGENMFVHAGLGLDFVNENYTIDEINSLAKWIGTAPAERTASNPRNAKLYDGTIGITWYREMVKDDIPISSANLDKVLSHFNASRIFVGHTIVFDVNVRYGGRVWAVNVDHSVNYPKNATAGILFEGGKIYRVNYTGQKRLPVTSVTVAPSELTIAKGETTTLTATALPTDAADMTLTWSSDKPGVATVDAQTGVVTALNRGTAVITATAVEGGATGSCTLTVTSDEVREYWEEEELVLLKAATRGNGINVIFMGDGYTKDMMKMGEGKYETEMRQAADYFVQPDPFSRYADCFNMWMVVGISNQAGISTTTDTSNTSYQKVTTNVDSAFGMIGRTTSSANINIKGSSTNFDTRAAKLTAYINRAITKIGAVKNETLVVLTANDPKWRGTCYKWDAGFAIAMQGNYPQTINNRGSVPAPGFALLVWHEASGHGFAQLYDEYQGYTTAFSGQASFQNAKAMGLNANVDVNLTTPLAVSKTSWAAFGNYPQYNNTVGVTEGAYYKTKQWRSDIAGEKKCTMVDNRIDFDAPSRWEIVKRIHKRGGLGDITFDQFVSDDTEANSLATAPLTRSSEWKAYEAIEDLPPCDPPVYVDHEK